MQTILSLGVKYEQLDTLYQQGINGLSYWCDRLRVPVSDNIFIPQYSLGIKEPIFNSAIYALCVLNKEGPMLLNYCGDKINQQADILLWLYQQKTPSVGWVYSPDNTIIDLLHQSYILNCFYEVYGVHSVENSVLDMVGQFGSAFGFQDSAKLHHDVSHLYSKTIPYLRKTDKCWLEIHKKRARLWSKGELLVLVSKLAVESNNSKAWFALGHEISDSIISDFSNKAEECQYSRYAMHAMHGLASYL